MGYSAFGTGFLILAMAVGAFLAGGVADELSRRLGAKRVVVLGMSLEVSGIVLLALFVSPTATSAMLVFGLVVYGFGLGLDSAQLTSVILEDVPMHQSGQASGMQSTSRQLGSAMGIAILGTALAVFLSASLSDDLDELGLPADTQSQLESSIIDSGGASLVEMRTSPALESEVEAGSAAYSTATKQVLLLAAAFYMCGLLVSLRLPDKPGGAAGTATEAVDEMREPTT